MRTNYELFKFADKYHIPLINIVNKDNLQYLTMTPGGYIINLSNEKDSIGRYNAGSHWVAFYIKNNKCIFMDSFGIVPDLEIQKALCHFIPYKYSTEQIQSLGSGICGDYCLFFIFFMSRSQKPLDQALIDFQRLFSKNTLENKRILQSLLKKYRLWYLN
jgi:hypothetical protein